MKMEKNLFNTDYLIIGASYAGSLLAAKLAEKGSVIIADRSEPGLRMNCGGGLPEKTFNKLNLNIPFVKADKIVMDILGKETSFPCRYVVVDRRELNLAVFRRAETAGAEFINASFLKHSPEARQASLRNKNGQELIVEYKKIIFCDGILKQNTRIPQPAHIKFPLPCGAAKVRILEGDTPYPGVLYFKITEKNPFGYSWVFPMPDHKINIGAGGFTESSIPEQFLEDLIKSENLTGRTLVRGGGILPVIPMPTVSDEDSILFGNAAGMVYALNGEGLKHIADSVNLWAESILNNRSLNLKWKLSSTYVKLRFAEFALQKLLKLSEKRGHSLYPAACRAAAASRRIIRM